MSPLPQDRTFAWGEVLGKDRCLQFFCCGPSVSPRISFHLWISYGGCIFSSNGPSKLKLIGSMSIVYLPTNLPEATKPLRQVCKWVATTPSLWNGCDLLEHQLTWRDAKRYTAIVCASFCFFWKMKRRRMEYITSSNAFAYNCMIYGLYIDISGNVFTLIFW